MIGADPFSTLAIKLLSPESTFKTVESVFRRLGVEPSQELRLTQRHAISEAVTIQPLDENYLPAGFECTALTRDISMNGIGLVCVDKFDTPYLRLTFQPCDETESNSLVIKVIHQTPRGALYIVGGNIAIDWSNDEDGHDEHQPRNPLYALAVLRDVRAMVKD